MSHINTNPGEHDYTVGAYIVRVDGLEPKALLHIHRRMNVLLPIGGHIEPDETIWQAIEREIDEESGYSLKQLDVLQPKERIAELSDVITHPSPVIMSTHALSKLNHFHTDTSFAFIANNDPAGEIDEGESQDLRWLGKNELKELKEDEIFPHTREIYLYILNECINKWEQVPSSSFSLDKKK